MSVEKRVGMSRHELKVVLLRRLAPLQYLEGLQSGKIDSGDLSTNQLLEQGGLGTLSQLAELFLDHQEEMSQLLEGVNEALAMKGYGPVIDKNNSAIVQLGERLDTQAQAIGGLRETSTSVMAQLGERAQGADDAIRGLREFTEDAWQRFQRTVDEHGELIATNTGAIGTWSDRFSEQIVAIAADATQALEKVAVVETMSTFVRATDARVLELERKALHAIERIDELKESQVENFNANIGHLAEATQRLDGRINSLGEAFNRHDSRLDDLDSICGDLILDTKRNKKRIAKLQEDEIPNVISGVGIAMDLISNLTTMVDGLDARINLNRQALDIHDDRFSNQSEMVNAHEEGLTNQAVMGRDQAIAIDDVNHDIQGLDEKSKGLDARFKAMEHRVIGMELKFPTETDMVNLNARMDSLHDRAKVLWDEMTQRTDANEAGLIGHDKRITEAKTNIIKVVDEINTLIADLNAQLGGHDSPIKLTSREGLRRPISHIPSPTGGLSEAEAMEAGGDDSDYEISHVTEDHPNDVKAPDERVNFIHATGDPRPLGDHPSTRRFHVLEPSVEETQLRAQLEERLNDFREAFTTVCEISSGGERQKYSVSGLGRVLNEIARGALQADDRQAEFTGLKATSDLMSAIARGDVQIQKRASYDLETTQLALEQNEDLMRQVEAKNTELAKLRPLVQELQDLRGMMARVLVTTRDVISLDPRFRPSRMVEGLISSIGKVLMAEEQTRVPDRQPIDEVTPQTPTDGLEREAVIIHEGNPSFDDAQVDWRDVENTPVKFERGSDGEVQGTTQWEEIQATANARRDSDREDHEG